MSFMPYAFQYEQKQQQATTQRAGKLAVFNTRLHLSSSTEEAHDVVNKESSILVKSIFYSISFSIWILICFLFSMIIFVIFGYNIVFTFFSSFPNRYVCLFLEIHFILLDWNWFVNQFKFKFAFLVFVFSVSFTEKFIFQDFLDSLKRRSVVFWFFWIWIFNWTLIYLRNHFHLICFDSKSIHFFFFFLPF